MSDLQLALLRVRSSDQIVSSNHVGTESFGDDFLHLDSPSSQIFFYIAKRDVILAKLEQVGLRYLTLVEMDIFLRCSLL
jgi:hypothetical protein